MLNTLNNNPIKIGIMEASSQNKAILEFFFSNSGKTSFKQTASDDAEAFIIDYDYPGAKESWENISKETGNPGIILSIKEVELPSTIWIAKPLTTSALIEAAGELREFIKNKTEVAAVADNKTEDVAIVEEKQTEVAVEETAKKQEKQAELAVAGSDDDYAMPVVDLSLDEETNTLEEATDDLEMPVVELTQEEEPEVATDAMIEFDSLNGIDEEKAEVEVTESSEITLAEPNIELEIPTAEISLQEEKIELAIDEPMQSKENTENLSVEINSNTSEVSISSFAVSPTMLNIDINEKTQETTEDITPGEEEIDSLLESLISGGKTKELEPEVEEIKSEIAEDILPLEASLETNVKENIADIVDAKIELETVEADSTADKVIEDDATSIIVEEFIQTGDVALAESGGVDVDSIGTEIYIDPDKPGEVETELDKNTAEEELQRLLDELKEEAETTPGTTVVKSPVTLDNDDSNAHSFTEAEDRWNLICGENENVKNPKDLDKSSFTLSNHMLSSFMDVLDQSQYTNKVMRLKFKGHIIVVDHASDFVYCDNSIFSDSYAEICFNSIDDSEIKIHELDKSEIRLYNTKRVEKSENSHTIESFIWTTSLLTARGRLLKYTDMNKKVGLKYWPNLTRLEQFPHAMQIAAVFYKHPGSLMEVSKWLDIEQRYIFAFYNAALSLKLIELDSKKIHTTSGDLDTGSKKNRGFFARLLKRIKS